MVDGTPPLVPTDDGCVVLREGGDAAQGREAVDEKPPSLGKAGRRECQELGLGQTDPMVKISVATCSVFSTLNEKEGFDSPEEDGEGSVEGEKTTEGGWVDVLEALQNDEAVSGAQRRHRNCGRTLPA